MSNYRDIYDEIEKSKPKPRKLPDPKVTLYAYAKEVYEQALKEYKAAEVVYAMDKAAFNKCQVVYGDKDAITKAWQKSAHEAKVKMDRCQAKHEDARAAIFALNTWCG